MIGTIISRSIFGIALTILAFALFGATQCDAAVIGTWNKDGRLYELTDEPYQDSRLSYALEGARQYVGARYDLQAVQCPGGQFKVLAMRTKDAPFINNPTLGLYSETTSMGKRCAIWLLDNYFNFRHGGRLIFNRASLCGATTHEILHAVDPDQSLDAHRADYPGDTEHVVQGYTPKVCYRLTKEDRLRKERIWCKRHKRECRKRRPDLSSTVLRHR